MLRRALSVCAVLGFVSAAHAGVAITLFPQPNTATYNPGEVVNVNVLAQLTAGTPSAPGPGGTTSLVRVRLMQFDLSDSDAALGISPVDHHPTSEPAGGPIPFWNFSGSTICAGDETQCGTNYFIDGNIAADDILNITYTGLSSSGSFMITLNQLDPKPVGELNVTMPTAPGTYILDVLNANETDDNQGAELRWGFGSTADPGSFTVRAEDGQITGGRFAFTVIPEPATLALLGMGGLAAAFRRRRSA